jgi:hypothetical protein
MTDFQPVRVSTMIANYACRWCCRAFMGVADTINGAYEWGWMHEKDGCAEPSCGATTCRSKG